MSDLVLVPREPTEEMLENAAGTLTVPRDVSAKKTLARQFYRAMIASASPQEGVREDADEIDYEVRQQDEMVASSTSMTDALHYCAVYGQDGPVELFEVRRRKIALRGEGAPS